MSNPDSNIDNTLFAEIQKGNIKAFDIIFNKYYSRLYAYAMQYVDTLDAEEVVQETMLWLWENKKRCNIISSVDQYLFRSVKNKCLSLIDRNNLKKKINIYLYNDFEKKQFEDPDFYNLKELSDRIEKAINNLPESYRIALEMNRFQHKTYKEIGDDLGISSKTVDYRIQQALKILRIELKDYLSIAIILSIFNN